MPLPETVRLIGIDFGYGGAPVLRGVSLEVPAGRFLTLLGPSGCGKTTLLKVIGGYLFPDAGSVILRGGDVTRKPPEDRDVGMVFQSYALFPHLCVRRNVSFSLEVRGIGKSEREKKVEAMLDLVGLNPSERDRLPATLSGGQQQRVALARALVFQPDLLLLDEPLANLDRHLRDQLRGELRRLQETSRVTAIMVTHDQEEAMAISDLVGVMHGGRLLQVGPPTEVYHNPRTPFVARFLGEANLLTGDTLGSESGSTVLIRPERILLGDPARACTWTRPGQIESIAFLGPDLLVGVRVAGGMPLCVRTRSSGIFRVGDEVLVGIPADAPWTIPEADPGELIL